MNNNLQIMGTQLFMGKDIPVILGGFGPEKRCICDKTVSEIHGQTERDIRKTIIRNLDRFRDGVDYIDVLQRGDEMTTLTVMQEIGYSKQSITQAEHLYILSERGYQKLIKIMDTDKAWEIYEKLLDEYFELKEDRITLPKDYSSALRSLADEVDKRAELEAKIVEQRPMVEFADHVGSTKDLITMSQMAKLAHDENIPIGRNKLFRWLKQHKYLCENNEPYQVYIDRGFFKVKETAKQTPYGSKLFTQTFVTGKGQIYLIEKLRNEFGQVDYVCYPA